MHDVSGNSHARVAETILFLTFATRFPLLAYCQCAAGSRPLELVGSGQLRSPNYPSNYPDNSACEWRITSTSQMVSLKFDVFSTEAKFDVLIMYDGANVTSPRIRSLSGLVNVATVYETTQTTMYITFVSDSVSTYEGFLATYQSTPVGGGTGGSTTPATVIGDACSASSRPARLYGTSGSFTSPNYPMNYYNNADCQWRILTPISSEIIKLDFRYLDTDYDYDVIAMYDGETIASPLIRAVSGSVATPPTGIKSTQQYMFVRFTTDERGVGGGFTASYTSVQRDEEPSWWISLIVVVAIVIAITLGCILYNRCKHKPNNLQPQETEIPAVDTVGVRTYSEMPVADTSSLPYAPQPFYASPPAYTDATAPPYGVLSFCSSCHVRVRADVRLVPCGHDTFCEDCTTLLLETRGQCPTCQLFITSVESTTKRY